MDRRVLGYVAQVLLIGQIVMACSLSPSDTEADNPPVPESSTTTAVPEAVTKPATVAETTPTTQNPYPLAGTSLIRHRLHWYVPQPE